MGFEADIKAMPEDYDYSLSFFKRFYRPENVVILIVGDVDAKTTFALIRKNYGGWKNGYVPPKITPEPPQTAERPACGCVRFTPTDTEPAFHEAIWLLADGTFGTGAEPA